MGKEQRYQNAASQLLRLVGGKENVISAAHCATRLRLVLKDESKADVDGILKTELIKGQFSTGGQFQIIIGSGTVDEVYKYFIQYADIKESSKNEVKKDADQKMNPLQKLVKMLADVFVPIIPALVASGLLMGLNNVLTAEGLFISGKSLVEAYPNKEFIDEAEDFMGPVELYSKSGFTVYHETDQKLVMRKQLK